MKNRNNKIDVERQLLDEEYDPLTLEDVPEKTEIDFHGVETSANAVVKEAFNKVSFFGIRVIESLHPLVVFGALFMLTVGLFGFIFCTVRFSEYKVVIEFIGGFLFLVAGVAGLYLLVQQIRRSICVYEVRFVQRGKEKMIFFIAKDRICYYRNRKQYIYLRLKDKSDITAKHKREQFMDIRLGFGSFAGNMKTKKTKTGYVISTTQLHRTGNVKLRTDKFYNPIKIGAGGGYYYIFSKPVDEHITLPRELLTYCDNRRIPRPPEDDRIHYV